ncbi:SAS10 protein, partial [Alcedo cyanopectus]|nr:SAS10 protein [Ceyx cyanopectus]
AMRTRRGTVLRPRPEPAEEDDGVEEAPGARAGPEDLADEVENFHEAQFRAVMAALESGDEAGDSEEEEEEEVLGLQLPEEDSEEQGEEGGEEEEEEEEQGGMDLYVEHSAEEDLPHELSWGKRKQFYYDTDYGTEPQAKGKRSQQDIDAEEEEEEQEAQVIQRRLVQDLGEDDYGLDVIQGYLAERQKSHAGEGRRIDRDLQALPKKEQLKLLKQEAPELLQLIEDLEVKLMELKDELHPLLQMVRSGAVPEGRGSRYLQTKYHLYLNYCTNISFYLLLKAKRLPVHSHPVIERLLSYRNLINQLSAVDQRLAPQARSLLRSHYDRREVRRQKEKEFAVFLPLEVKKAQARRARGLADGRASPEASEGSEQDEEAALKYYRLMEEKLKLKRKRSEARDARDASAPPGGEDADGKRGVTYQMLKNKGLTPRRRKLDRNPRVKHREKFRRAGIRRRGQVREARRELQRYAGERSGIRAGVKKSRKLQ